MHAHAPGAFEVTLSPQPSTTGQPLFGRLRIDKTFSGDLSATRIGEMLTAGTQTKGSAVYVAIEQITGSLGGRSGSFVLRHVSSMNRGVPELLVSVVPDSGAGELEGLAGPATREVLPRRGRAAGRADGGPAFPFRRNGGNASHHTRKEF